MIHDSVFFSFTNSDNLTWSKMLFSFGTSKIYLLVRNKSNTQIVFELWAWCCQLQGLNLKLMKSKGIHKMMQDKLFIFTKPPSIVDMEIPWSEYIFYTKSNIFIITLNRQYLKGENYFHQAEANSSVRRRFIHLASQQSCSYEATKAFLIKNVFVFFFILNTFLK